MPRAESILSGHRPVESEPSTGFRSLFCADAKSVYHHSLFIRAQTQRLLLTLFPTSSAFFLHSSNIEFTAFSELFSRLYRALRQSASKTLIVQLIQHDWDLCSRGLPNLSLRELEYTLIQIAINFGCTGCVEELIEFLDALLLQITFQTDTQQLVWREADEIQYDSEWRHQLSSKYLAILNALQDCGLIGSSNQHSSLEHENINSSFSSDFSAKWKPSLKWQFHVKPAVDVSAVEPDSTSPADSTCRSEDLAESKPHTERSPSQLNQQSCDLDITEIDLIRDFVRPKRTYLPVKASSQPIRFQKPRINLTPIPAPDETVSIQLALSQLRIEMFEHRLTLSNLVHDVCGMLSRADGSMTRNAKFQNLVSNFRMLSSMQVKLWSFHSAWTLITSALFPNPDSTLFHSEPSRVPIPLFMKASLIMTAEQDASECFSKLCNLGIFDPKLLQLPLSFESVQGITDSVKLASLAALKLSIFLRSGICKVIQRGLPDLLSDESELMALHMEFNDQSADNDNHISVVAPEEFDVEADPIVLSPGDFEVRNAISQVCGQSSGPWQMNMVDSSAESAPFRLNTTNSIKNMLTDKHKQGNLRFAPPQRRPLLVIGKRSLGFDRLGLVPPEPISDHGSKQSLEEMKAEYLPLMKRSLSSEVLEAPTIPNPGIVFLDLEEEKRLHDEDHARLKRWLHVSDVQKLINQFSRQLKLAVRKHVRDQLFLAYSQHRLVLSKMESSELGSLLFSKSFRMKIAAPPRLPPMQLTSLSDARRHDAEYGMAQSLKDSGASDIEIELRLRLWREQEQRKQQPQQIRPVWVSPKASTLKRAPTLSAVDQQTIDQSLALIPRKANTPLRPPVIPVNAAVVKPPIVEPEPKVAEEPEIKPVSVRKLRKARKPKKFRVGAAHEFEFNDEDFDKDWEESEYFVERPLSVTPPPEGVPNDDELTRKQLALKHRFGFQGDNEIDEPNAAMAGAAQSGLTSKALLHAPAPEKATKKGKKSQKSDSHAGQSDPSETRRIEDTRTPTPPPARPSSAFDLPKVFQYSYGSSLFGADDEDDLSGRRRRKKRTFLDQALTDALNALKRQKRANTEQAVHGLKQWQRGLLLLPQLGGAAAEPVQMTEAQRERLAAKLKAKAESALERKRNRGADADDSSFDDEFSESDITDEELEEENIEDQVLVTTSTQQISRKELRRTILEKHQQNLAEEEEDYRRYVLSPFAKKWGDELMNELEASERESFEKERHHRNTAMRQMLAQFETGRGWWMQRRTARHHMQIKVHRQMLRALDERRIRKRKAYDLARSRHLAAVAARKQQASVGSDISLQGNRSSNRRGSLISTEAEWAELKILQKERAVTEAAVQLGVINTTAVEFLFSDQLDEKPDANLVGPKSSISSRQNRDRHQVRLDPLLSANASFVAVSSSSLTVSVLPTQSDVISASAEKAQTVTVPINIPSVKNKKNAPVSELTRLYVQSDESKQAAASANPPTAPLSPMRVPLSVRMRDSIIDNSLKKASTTQVTSPTLKSNLFAEAHAAYLADEAKKAASSITANVSKVEDAILDSKPAMLPSLTTEPSILNSNELQSSPDPIESAAEHVITLSEATIPAVFPVFLDEFSLTDESTISNSVATEIPSKIIVPFMAVVVPDTQPLQSDSIFPGSIVVPISEDSSNSSIQLPMISGDTDLVPLVLEVSDSPLPESNQPVPVVQSTDTIQTDEQMTLISNIHDEFSEEINSESERPSASLVVALAEISSIAQVGDFESPAELISAPVVDTSTTQTVDSSLPDGISSIFARDESTIQQNSSSPTNRLHAHADLAVELSHDTSAAISTSDVNHVVSPDVSPVVADEFPNQGNEADSAFVPEITPISSYTDSAPGSSDVLSTSSDAPATEPSKAEVAIELSPVPMSSQNAQEDLPISAAVDVHTPTHSALPATPASVTSRLYSMQRASSLLRSRAPVESTKYQSVPYSPRFKPSLCSSPLVTIDLPSTPNKFTAATHEISSSPDVPVIVEHDISSGQIERGTSPTQEIESVDEISFVHVQSNHDAPIEYDPDSGSNGDLVVEVVRIQSSMSVSHSTPLTSHAGTPLLERNVSSEFFLSDTEPHYPSVDAAVDVANESHHNIVFDSLESEVLVESAKFPAEPEAPHKPIDRTHKQSRPRVKKVYLSVTEFAQSVLSSALSTLAGFLLLQLPQIQSSAQSLTSVVDSELIRLLRLLRKLKSTSIDSFGFFLPPPSYVRAAASSVALSMSDTLTALPNSKFARGAANFVDVRLQVVRGQRQPVKVTQFSTQSPRAIDHLVPSPAKRFHELVQRAQISPPRQVKQAGAELEPAVPLVPTKSPRRLHKVAIDFTAIKPKPRPKPKLRQINPDTMTSPPVVPSHTNLLLSAVEASNYSMDSGLLDQSRKRLIAAASDIELHAKQAAHTSSKIRMDMVKRLSQLDSIAVPAYSLSDAADAKQKPRSQQQLQQQSVPTPSPRRKAIKPSVVQSTSPPKQASSKVQLSVRAVPLHSPPIVSPNRARRLKASVVLSPGQHSADAWSASFDPNSDGDAAVAALIRGDVDIDESIEQHDGSDREVLKLPPIHTSRPNSAQSNSSVDPFFV